MEKKMNKLEKTVVRAFVTCALLVGVGKAIDNDYVTAIGAGGLAGGIVGYASLKSKKQY